MLNVKYYKDLSHNYLIIRGEDDKESSYPYRMITENKFKVFLKCSHRKVNDETLMYYEISSKQSLRSRFGTKGIDYSQLYEIFEGIKQAILEAGDYLLSGEGILLHPDYIFYDLEWKRYFFVYYPDGKSGQELLIEFAEFLVDHANHKEDAALETAYAIFELVQDGGLTIEKIEHLFEKETEEIQTEHTKPRIEETVTEKIQERTHQKDQEDAAFLPEEEGLQERPKLMPTILFMALSVLGAVGLCCLRVLFVLTFFESAMTLLGMGILLVTAVLLLLYLLNALRSGDRTGIDKQNIESKPEAADWLSIQREQSGKSIGGQQVRETMPELLYAQKTSKDTVGDEAEIEDEEYGNTIFLEASLNRRENKLYGINKGNKYHIDLAKLPLTVGKLAGGVDFAIKDASISRIHAQFTKEGDSIYVADLNSTNGTFKNGLRLEPHEVVLIEAGDEIRLGNMDFIYR